MSECRRSRAGFTSIELFIVLAIVMVLIALLLPSVQSAREAARRTQCKNNLSQIALALQNYEMAFEVLPPGTVNPAGPIVNRKASNAYHVSWTVAILPHLELSTIYRRFDFRFGVYDRRNQTPQSQGIVLYSCPSSGSGGGYAGCHAGRETPIDADNDGCLFLNSAVRVDDIPDGCGHTIACGEATGMSVWGWASGTRDTLRNTGWELNASNVFPAGGEIRVEDFSGQTGLDAAYAFDEVNPATARPIDLAVGGFGSSPPGGAQFSFCDGSVRFIAEGSTGPRSAR